MIKSKNYSSKSLQFNSLATTRCSIERSENKNEHQEEEKIDEDTAEMRLSDEDLHIEEKESEILEKDEELKNEV